MKIIELNETVTASNDRDADALRELMQLHDCLLVNVMSSPGAGKTTLLSRIIRDMSGPKRPPGLKRSYIISVMEADIDSEVDAERIRSLGANAIQVHTSGMCHMDAGMTTAAYHAMDGFADLVFLENVGNLICPAEYDTGAGRDIMLLSVPEGDDKPLKYPLMFQKSDALVITKMDALPYFDFDLNTCVERARKLNPTIKIFPVSAKTGEGMEALELWLEEQLRSWRPEDKHKEN